MEGPAGAGRGAAEVQPAAPVTDGCGGEDGPVGDGLDLKLLGIDLVLLDSLVAMGFQQLACIHALQTGQCTPEPLRTPQPPHRNRSCDLYLVDMLTGRSVDAAIGWLFEHEGDPLLTCPPKPKPPSAISRQPPLPSESPDTPGGPLHALHSLRFPPKAYKMVAPMIVHPPAFLPHCRSGDELPF